MFGQLDPSIPSSFQFRSNMKQLAALVIGLSTATTVQAITVQLQIYAATCVGDNGVIVSTVSGGAPPYTYAWSMGATTDIVYSLAPGTYSLTVTDNLGAQATVNCEVALVSQPPSNMTPFDYLGLGGLEPCWNGACDGGFRVHLLRVMGGYSISTTFSMSYIELPEDEPSNLDYYITYEFLGACAGSPITLTLSSGCGTGTSTVTLDALPVPQVNTQLITASCNGADDGALFGQVLLAASPSTGWTQSWTMVAVDAPVGGNEVDPTPAYFDAGTTPFQVLGLHPGIWDLLFTTTESIGSAQLPCQYASPFVIPDLGPDCATVSGTVHFETDMDCTQDGLEVGMPNQLLRVTPGPLYGITAMDGSYVIAVPYGTYALEQLNTDAVQLCPPIAPIAFSVGAGSNAAVDIADSLTTPFDMGVYLLNSVSRVGLPFNYAIHLVNHTGHPGENVTVTLDFDPLFSYIGSAPGVSSNGPGQVQWTLPVLGPFEGRWLNVQVQVPANPALLGTVHVATAVAQGTTFDGNPANNSHGITHTIVASYDPNDKQAITSSGQNEAVYLLDVDEYIDYRIRFQNMGTDTAFNVTVTDTISPLLDMASLQILGSSHPFTASIATGNVLSFTFANIRLPDSNVNEPASQGHIAFRIRPVPGIAIGSTIDNTADIYFDFNDPVRTTTASLEVGITTNLHEPHTSGIRLSPVPASGMLNIRADGAVISAVRISALDGRTVGSFGNTNVVDVSALAPGVYILTVRTRTGAELKTRFVKD